MAAIVISIGDELTSGQTINTNASWLSGQLAGLGIETVAQVTVPDRLLAIVEAIRGAMEKRVEVILISGGLGPTEDDLTRQGLADALGEELVEDPAAVVQIEQWFASRGRKMSGSNRLQALRPRSAEVIPNPAGTAPGLRVERDGMRIYVMPGVPGEMKMMFATYVWDWLNGISGERVTMISKVNTFGRGESVIGEAIKDLMVRGANPSVGTTANEGIVSVRIYATGTVAEVREMTLRVKEEVKKRLGEICFGEDEERIEEVVGKMLKERRRTVATAESCTGGLMAKMLTDVAGSSAYFMRGWVTYANQAKSDELAILPEVIEKHGAVSEEVARAMAEGARRFAETDFAISTTGVAGPEGGSAEKPVGTVLLGLAHEGGTEARRFVFPGDRKGVRLRAAQMGLAMLRWRMRGVSVE
ncbi:MAG: competence/damage-inducible protein A [Phycisphaerae bacterium]